MTKRKRRRLSTKGKIIAIMLLIPVSITAFTLSLILWLAMADSNLLKKSTNALLDMQEKQQNTAEIPEEYIPIYKAAAEEYKIPWTLLAAHHRIETRFSTMDPMLSPVGAEGHMQFMPCTFVGWKHPSCGGLGEGDIPEKEKTDPAVIAQYGGYGVDANNDGIADPFDIEDAMYSAANYLARSGAATGDYEKAIFDYNRSDKYVEDVLWFFDRFEEYRLQHEAAQ